MHLISSIVTACTRTEWVASYSIYSIEDINPCIKQAAGTSPYRSSTAGCNIFLPSTEKEGSNVRQGSESLPLAVEQGEAQQGDAHRPTHIS